MAGVEEGEEEAVVTLELEGVALAVAEPERLLRAL